MLNVEIKGLKELQAAFKKAPAIVKPEAEAAIKKTIITLMKYAMINFQYFPLSSLKNPNSPRTGFLMGAGRGMVDSYAQLIGRLENVAPYALWVHDGTEKMQPKRPFFELAIEQAQPEVDKFFDDALANIVSKMAK